MEGVSESMEGVSGTWKEEEEGEEEEERRGREEKRKPPHEGMDATRAGAATRRNRRFRLSRHHGWLGLTHLPMMTSVPTSNNMCGTLLSTSLGLPPNLSCMPIKHTWGQP